jgi:NAD(P)-dependent dehydrogenase (short-subunit alcohol dehydrogenase family)
MQDLFSLAGKVAIVTGATGVLGSEMTRSLARSGARVAVLGRRVEKAHRVAGEIEAAGGQSLVLPADVLDTGQLEDARDALLERWGGVDILVNAAGGNVPEATLSDGIGFFELPENALRQVMDLNFLGTLLPCQIFGAAMVEGAEEPDGCIVNISSMAAAKTLTNVVGYSAAKAAVDNFTRWLAVELARSYGPGLRVNAIAPGFFIGEQNRDLLLDEDGSPSHTGGTFRRTRRVGGHPDLALQPGLRLRQRNRRARRRRLLRLQRGVDQHVSMLRPLAFACQHAASLRWAASQHFSKSSRSLPTSVEPYCRW